MYPRGRKEWVGLPTSQMCWLMCLWDLLALEALRPMAVLAPHMVSKERAWSWTTPRSKLSHLDDHTTAACGSPKMVFYIGEGTLFAAFFFFFFFLAGFSSGFLEGMGFWDKSLHSTRLCIIGIKTSFLSHRPLPLEFVYWCLSTGVSAQPNPHFHLLTCCQIR